MLEGKVTVIAKPSPAVDTSRPEIVVALVGSTGTDLSSVEKAAQESLARFGYSCRSVKLITLLKEIPKWAAVLPEEPEEDRIGKAMDAGDDFREEAGRGDALALLGLGAVRQCREEISGSPNKSAPSTAFIIRSLKRPEEVDALRRVYGSSFFLVGAYAPRKSRVAEVARRIAQSHNSSDIEKYRSSSEHLIHRDQEESGRKFGQKLRDTFPLADYFVDASKPSSMRAAIDRFFDLVFVHPFRTPAKDEYGMFHAQAAALRSAALGRQVGAVVATVSGDIVSIGTNEVPKAGGGLYWCDDHSDGRDFTLGHDSMDRFRRTMLGEMVERLKTAGWLATSKAAVPDSDLVDQMLSKGKPESMQGTQLMNVLEFGRIVHAEMAAIVDAARRGVSVSGCTLFVTTFPCHNCARHVVAAGIKRVVYIEPYPKSLASLLHMDSLSADGEATADQVGFEPYVGLAPSRYMEFFRMPDRKKPNGDIVDWAPLAAFPRVSPADEASSLAKEAQELTLMEPFLKDLLSE